MSNEANDKIMDEVREYVTNVWVLSSRPDLEADCIDYTYENYLDTEGLKPISEIVIEFLSKHCTNAISTQDLEVMAMEDRLRVEYQNGC